jgi:hypothetical protein
LTDDFRPLFGLQRARQNLTRRRRAPAGEHDQRRFL